MKKKHGERGTKLDDILNSNSKTPRRRNNDAKLLEEGNSHCETMTKLLPYR